MAKSHTKYRKTENPQKVDYFTDWKRGKSYLGGSTVTYNTDAYIIPEDYTASDNFENDYTEGKLVRISNPTTSENVRLGPYYTRSGGSKRPTVTHGMKWLGSQYFLYRVRIIGSGGGDRGDGGSPWTSYRYYFYFKRIDE